MSQLRRVLISVVCLCMTNFSCYSFQLHQEQISSQRLNHNNININHNIFRYRRQQESVQYHRRRALPIPDIVTSSGVDPTDIADAIMNGVGHLNQLVAGEHASTIIDSASSDVAATTTTTTTTAAAHHLETLLSTMYTASADVMLQPAHGHTQPLWGPPDPILSAGKSVAPSAKALLDMGIQKASESLPVIAADNAAASASSGVAADATTGTLSNSAGVLATKVEKAISYGWNILDTKNIKSENLLPGFSETRGILPTHSVRVPDETPESFAAQVEWSARFINVIDKIPYVAFMYAFFEFFFLRPNLDLYKEDIEEEPSQAFVETAMVTGVRVGAFALVALFTVILFG